MIHYLSTQASTLVIMAETALKTAVFLKHVAPPPRIHCDDMQFISPMHSRFCAAEPLTVTAIFE